MKRNNLIDRLAVILTRKDNGEQYVVTELGLPFKSDCEQAFKWVILKSLSSNSTFETNDFELLQSVFNISDPLSLRRYFSDGYDTYGVIEVTPNSVIIGNQKDNFETSGLQGIEIYEDLNDRMIDVSYSQRYGICSLGYFMKKFHELTTDEHLYCNNTEGIPLNSF